MTAPASKLRPAFGRWLAFAGLSLAAVVLGVFFFTRPPTAGVVTPEIREVVDLVVVSGRLRAVREASIGAELSGTVEEALVREGDQVAEGQALARISMVDYVSQLQQARAARETNVAELEVAALAAAQAKRDLARVEELAGRGVSSTADLETARGGKCRARPVGRKRCGLAGARTPAREANRECALCRHCYPAHGGAGAEHRPRHVPLPGGRDVGGRDLRGNG